MKRALIFCVACAVAGIAVPGHAASPAIAGAVYVVKIDGAITPATTDYAVRGIRRAGEQGAELVVLQMDTPGGLDKSMRTLIKEIVNSPVPVASYVYPSGARAASAGTYILYASHVAAMAPATNVGAATPVAIGLPGGPDPGRGEKPDAGTKGGGDKGRAAQDAAEPKDVSGAKQLQDAAAYIRGLAQLRGRNAQWAERAVREAVSVSAEEAVKLKVADLIARDMEDLFAQLDGRRVTVKGGERTLHTAGVQVVTLETDWRSRLLAAITDPNVALILMMLGVYGLFFEFANPGFVAPGVIGGICLLLALYAFQMLPINYAGLALVALGIAFMVAEAFVPSFGALGIGGAIAFAIGAVILLDAEQTGLEIGWSVAVGVAATSMLLVAFTATLALHARRRPVVSGREELAGAAGEVIASGDGQAWARVHGETWQVQSRAPLEPGQRIRVVRVEGLVLHVESDSKDRGDLP